MGIKIYREDGTVEEVSDETFTGEPPLDWLKQKVGGWIEVVYGLTLDDVACQIIIDEEGKLKGKGKNMPATKLWYRFCGEKKGFIPRDFLVGDCVMLTPPHHLR